MYIYVYVSVMNNLITVVYRWSS